MVNPIPAGWQTLASTVGSIQRFKYDDDDEVQQQQQPPQQHQKASRSKIVVFDTMVDESWLRRLSTASSNGNIRRQKTIRNEENVDEPKQYFIHSQHQSSSWASNFKTFLQSARSLEKDDDNDALCWCE